MIAPVMVLAASVVAAASQSPNFIMILTDDISQNDLGCYGNTLVRTPHLDQMAAQGVKFTNAYLTCSSCSPSRCSLITGRYPHNTGACELHTLLPDGHVLFPALLRDAGYYTVLSGKHHMGSNADSAFDVVSPGEPPGRQGDWVRILQERPRQKPFFFWFASGDAHRPWTESADAPTYDPNDVQVPPYLVDGPLTRRDFADYYHEVSRTDTFAGRLVAELEEQGIANSTYVIYLSDNGRPFPRCKTRLYDSGLKSPLIVYAPGRLQPLVNEQLVSVNVDLGPTILELAGLSVPDRMQGVSFVGSLSDAQHVTRDYVFAEHNWHVMQAHQRLVRSGDWVYLRNAYPERPAMCVESGPKFPAGRELWAFEAEGRLNPSQRDVFLQPRPTDELYDLVADPHQLNNLANDASLKSRLLELRDALDRWSAATSDSVPSDPTPDREDAHGAKHPGWSHRVQPGIEVGSLESNAKGPVRRDDLRN